MILLFTIMRQIGNEKLYLKIYKKVTKSVDISFYTWYYIQAFDETGL